MGENNIYKGESVGTSANPLILVPKKGLKCIKAEKKHAERISETEPASSSSSSLAIKRMGLGVFLLSWAGYCAVTTSAKDLAFAF